MESIYIYNKTADEFINYKYFLMLTMHLSM